MFNVQEYYNVKVQGSNPHMHDVHEEGRLCMMCMKKTHIKTMARGNCAKNVDLRLLPVTTKLSFDADRNFAYIASQ